MGKFNVVDVNGHSVSVVGNHLTLTEGSVVKLNIDPEQIQTTSRQGNDLVIRLVDGEILTISGFFTTSGQHSELAVQQNNGALWWLESVGSSEAHFSSIITVSDIPLASQGLSAAAQATAWTLGSLAAAGAGLLLAGGGKNKHDSESASSFSNDTQPLPPHNDPITDPVNTPVDERAITLVDENNKTITPGLTNHAEFTLSGQVASGHTIHIYDNNKLIASVIPDATGAWLYTTETLTEGEHSLNVVVEDQSGNVVTTSDNINLTVDTIAPDPVSNITITSEQSGKSVIGEHTSDHALVLRGRAEIGSQITIYDNGIAIGQTTATGALQTRMLLSSTHKALGVLSVKADGYWYFEPVSLSVGMHKFATSVKDKAGNTTPISQTMEVTIDPPFADSSKTEITDSQGRSVKNGVTNDLSINVTGKGAVGSTITLYDNNKPIATVVVDQKGNWSYAMDNLLSPGEHRLTTTETDRYGNQSNRSAPINVEIDTTAPAAASDLSLTDTAGRSLADQRSNDTTPELKGRAEAGSTITVYDGETVVGTALTDKDGQWQFSVPTLNEGSHSLSVTVTDPAGNTGVKSSAVAVTIDTTAPAAASDLSLTDTAGRSLADQRSNDTTPTLIGHAEAGSTITVYDGETVVGTALTDKDGQWQFSVPTLDEGSHSLSVTVTDPAGNTGVKSSAVAVTIDTTAPAAASDLSLTDNNGKVLNSASSNDTTPTLIGHAEAGSTITVYDGETVVGTALTDKDGQWQFSVPTLNEGSHSLSVTVTDPAGNTGVKSSAVAVTIDTTAPAAASDLSLTDNNGKVLNSASSNDTTPTLIGHAEAGSTITVYDGETVVGTALTDKDGQWQFSVPTLDEGSHSLSVTVTDPAGNTGVKSSAVAVTIDTTAPAAASDLSLTDTAGRSLADQRSNDTTPTLIGHAEAGSTITVYDGETVVGTALTDKDGQWQFSVPTLNEGSHSLSVTVTDPAGNTGVKSSAVAVTIDTTAPAAASDLSLTDTAGRSLADQRSNDTTPTLIGHAEAGSTITVYDGETVVGTALTDKDGQWQFSVPTLNEGSHSLSVTVTDPAGNTGVKSSAVAVTIDTTAPAAASDLSLTDTAGRSLADQRSNDTTPELKGRAEAGSTITVYDGETVVGTALTDKDGQWQFSVPTLNEGSHSLSVTVTDPAGNTGVKSSAVAVTIDTTAPAAASDLSLTDTAGRSLADQRSNDTTPTLIGHAEAGSTITVYDGETVVGTALTDKDGQWQFSVPTLNEGSHSLSVTVTDPAGNTGVKSSAVAVTIDTTAPAAASDLSLTDNNGKVLNSASSNDTTPTLIGHAEAGSTITVYDGETVVGTALTDKDGQWQFSVPTLDEGSHSLSVTVTDPAGNTGVKSSAVAVTIDTTAPAAASDLSLTDTAGRSLADQRSNDTTPTLIGHAEAGSTITVYDGETVVGTALTDKDGQWQFSVPTLNEGSHSLSVTVTDPAGNTGVKSSAVAVTIDTTAPAAASDLSLTDNNGKVLNSASSNDTTPTLIGRAEAGSTITVYDGETVVGTALTDKDGQWQFSVPTLNEGSHSLSVTVTDPAGNTGVKSSAVAVTIDTTAPAAASDLSLTDNNGKVLNSASSNDTTPTLIGHAEAGSTITVYDGETVIGTALTDKDGQWQFSVPTLNEGSHSLSVTVTDPAGNTGIKSSAVAVTIDTTAPAAASDLSLTDTAGRSLADQRSNDTTPELKGRAEAGSTITVYDGETVIGTALTDKDGQWQFSVPTLNEGSHSLSVTVTDPAGNTGIKSSAVAVTIDTTAPAAASDLRLTDTAGRSLADQRSNDTTPELKGRAEAGSTITVYDGETVVGTALTDKDGQWQFSVPTLNEGSHSLSVTVTDPAGNTGVKSSAVAVTIDTTAPAAASDLSLTDNNGKVLNSASSNDTTPELKGRAEAGSTITVYDGETVVGTALTDKDGQWQFSVPTLNEGSHSLSVTVTDPAGNTGVKSSAVAVTIDTTAPAAASDLSLTDTAGRSLADQRSNDTTPTLIGHAEAGSTITVYDGETVVGTALTDKDGQWQFNVPTLNEGSHSLSVTVTDPAGNTGVKSSAVAVTIDTTAPAAASDLSLTDNNGKVLNSASSNDTTPTLIGHAEAGSTITVYDGETVVGTALTDKDGQWQFSVPTLDEGSHSLSVTVTDPAGNTGIKSSAVAVTIDTTAPAAASDLSLTDTAGRNLADQRSNDTTPELKGRAEAGSTITVYDGETVVGTALTDKDGQWQFSVPTLDEGSHSLSVTVTDPAGNTGVKSSAVAVTIDTTAPAAASDLSLTDTAGRSLADQRSNDTTPTLIGHAEAGSTITVYDGETVVGTALTDKDGQWQFNVPTLNEGSHSLSVTVTDPAGNTGVKSSAVAVTIDTTAPAAASDLRLTDTAGRSLADQRSNDTTPELKGRAEAGSTITVYDGETVVGTALTDKDGQWQFSVPTLDEGSHSLSVTVTDPAGNTGVKSSAVAVTIDTTAPAAASDLSLTDNNGKVLNSASSNDTTPELKGHAEAGSTITVYDGETVVGTALTDKDGQWQFSVPTLNEGSHSLSVTVTDPAGNTGVKSSAVAVTIDTTAPAAASDLSLTDNNGKVLNSASSNDTTPELKGRAEAGSTITVYDGETVVGTALTDKDGQWQFSVPTLNEGSHSLSVTVTDPAGNTGVKSSAVAVTIDTTAPAAASDLRLTDTAGRSLADQRSNDTTPELKGRAEAGSTITVYDGETVVGTALTDKDGQWQFSVPTLDEGSHSLSVTVTDPAGNTGVKSSAVAVTIDTTAPAAASDLSLTDTAGRSLADQRSNDTTPELKGRAEAGSTITVYDGETVVGTALTDKDGQWQFSVPTLNEGSHSLSVTVTDPAGNTGVKSSAVAVTIDTTAPAAASDLSLTDTAGRSLAYQRSNDTTPTLIGHAEAGSTITVYDGETVVGTALTDKDGQWQFSVPTLDEGSHSLSVTVTDPAGNTGVKSSAVAVTIDTTAPAAASDLSLTDNNGKVLNSASSNDTTPTLIGHAEAGSTITVYDGETVVGTALTDKGGQWQFSVPTLNEGSHSLSVTVTDPAGNTGVKSSAVAVTIDTTAPAAASDLSLTDTAGRSLADQRSNDTTPTLIGHAEAGSTITVYDGETVVGTALTDKDGQWQFSVPTLNEGSHSLSVTVTDPAGNTGVKSSAVAVTIDTTAPAAASDLSLTDTAGRSLADQRSNDTTPTLIGHAEAGSTITVYDGETVVGTALTDKDGQWQFSVPTLNEGSHSLSVTVTDPAGNTGVKSSAVAVTIDTTAPAAASDLSLTDDQGQTLVDHHSYESTPTLQGQAEPGSKVTIYDNGQEVGQATTDQQGKWTFTFDPALEPGEHTLTTRVTDQAGNQGDESKGIAFTLDPSSALQASDDSHTAEIGAEHDNLNGTTGSVTQLLGVSLLGLIDVSVLDGNSFVFNVKAGSTEDVQLKISGNTLLGTGAIVQQLLNLLGVKEFSTDLSIVNRSTGQVVQIIKNAVTITAEGLGLNYHGEVAVNGLAAGDYSALVTSTSNKGLLGTLLDLLAQLNIGAKTDITIDDSVAYLAETTQGNVLHNDSKGDVADTGDDIHVIKIVANDVSDSHVIDVDRHGVTVQGLYGTLTIQADGSYSYHSAGDSSNIGKIEHFTYTIQDAHGQSKSAQITVKVEGTHSVAVDDYANLNDTTVYPDSHATSFDTDALTVSGEIEKNKSIDFDNKINFSVDHQQSLADITITIDVSAAKKGVFGTVDTTFSGKVTLYQWVTDSDGSRHQTQVWQGDFNQLLKATSIQANNAEKITLSLNDLDLPSGDYQLEVSGDVSSDTHVDYKLTASIEGQLTDTSSHYTTEQTASGNIVNDHDATGQADSLGSLFSSLRLSGQSTDGKQHTWQLSRNGVITEDNQPLTGASHIEIQGKYGVLTLMPDGSFQYTLTAGIDVSTIINKETFTYSLVDKDGTSSSATLTMDLHPMITGSINSENLHGSAYDDTFVSGSGSDSLVYNVLTDDNTGGNGHDTWQDFSLQHNDKIDISDLLIGWDQSISSLHNFISVSYTSSGDTVIYLDRDGNGASRYQAVEFLTLKNIKLSLDDLLQKVIVANSTPLQAEDDTNSVTLQSQHSTLIGTEGSISQAAGIKLAGDFSLSLLNANSFAFHVAEHTTEDLHLQVSGGTSLSLGVVTETIRKLLGGKDAFADVSIIDKTTGKVVMVIADAVTINAEGTGLNYHGEVRISNLPAGDYSAAVTTTSTGSVLDQLLQTLSSLGIGTSLNMKVTDAAQYSASAIAGNVLQTDGAGSVADQGDGIHVLKVVSNLLAGSQAVSVSSTGTTIQGLYGKLTIYADGSYRYQVEGSRQSFGQSDSFTYTITDSHDNTVTAHLNIQLSGSESTADRLAPSFDVPLTFTEAQAITLDANGLKASGSAKNKSVTPIHSSMTFDVEDHHVMQGTSINLTFKLAPNSLDRITGGHFTGLIAINLLTTDASGQSVTTRIWSQQIDQNISGLGGHSDQLSAILSDLDLAAGHYELVLNSELTSTHNQDYSIEASVSGSTLDTTTHYTTEQQVTGNLHQEGSTHLGSLFDYLSISGNDANGQSHHWTLQAQGSFQNEQGQTLAGSTLQLYGKYGMLTLNNDGSYVYQLKAGLDVNSLTSKEVFDYVLHDSNQHRSSGSLTIDLHPEITGSANNDSLHSTAYDDIFTSKAGADSIVYQLLSDDDSGGNGHDTWRDFSMDQGDSIDVSALLVGWDGQQQSLSHYLSVTQTEKGDTVITIDRDGHTASHYHDTALLTLEGVKVSLDELIEQHHIH